MASGLVNPAGLGADGTSGGDTTADAALSLAVPANQAAGSYTGDDHADAVVS